MTNSKLETWVGSFVLLIALFFFAFAYRSTSIVDFSGKYNLIAKFDNADGLNPGTDVRIAGVKVGSIQSVKINTNDYLAEVVFTVNNDIELPEDSVAQITSQGLLGENYLAMQPGASDVRLAEGDEVAYTQGSANLIELISKTMFSGDSEK